jgi:hypothetical protein
MATFRGVDLFSPGPSRIIPGATEAEVKITRFPGLDGEHHLNMGRPGATLVQEGTLVATSASALKSRINGLNAQVGERGTLADDFGFSYEDCTMTRVRFHQPRRVDAAGNLYLDYTVEYRQAVSSIS